MDDLDVKILRALISESAVSPSNPQLRSSLRGIAARLGTDDATVSYGTESYSSQATCQFGSSWLIPPSLAARWCG
jgi:hypothetical protein